MAILFACIICMPFAANAKCGLPAEVDDLVAKLRLTMSAGIGTIPVRAAEVGRLVASIDREKVAYALNTIDLPRSRGVVDYLIREAEVIAAKRDVPNRRELKRQIRVYDELATKACRKQAEGGEKKTRYNGISQLSASTPTNNGAESDGTFELPNRSLLFLALLAPGVVGLLAALAGCRLAYQWISAFTFSHRSCKIAATLECGLDFVDGHIIILGKKGLRFKPVSDDDYEQLEWLDDFEDCIINVGPHRLFGRIDGLHGSFAVFFFEQKIKDELLNVLMEASSVPPKYVRRSTPKSKQKNTKTTPHRPVLQNT